MSLFVPEYTALAIVLLIFGYHALKELTSDDGADEREAKNNQRKRENTSR